MGKNNTYLLQKQSNKLAHKIQVTSEQTDCIQILKMLMHEQSLRIKSP